MLACQRSLYVRALYPKRRSEEYEGEREHDGTPCATNHFHRESLNGCESCVKATLLWRRREVYGAVPLAMRSRDDRTHLALTVFGHICIGNVKIFHLLVGSLCKNVHQNFCITTRTSHGMVQHLGVPLHAWEQQVLHKRLLGWTVIDKCDRG